MGKKITIILFTLLLTNWYSSAQYNRGDYVDGGIVFYSSSTKLGIISVAETTAEWQYDDSVTRTGSTNSHDGKYNTGLMTHSPAKDWIDSLGEGWFLPTLNDYTVIFRYYLDIDKGLERIGAPKLCNGYNDNMCIFWTSEEVEDIPELAQAFDLYEHLTNRMSGGFIYQDKGSIRRVRGVKVIELSE